MASYQLLAISKIKNMNQSSNLDLATHAEQILNKWGLSQPQKNNLLGSNSFLDVSELEITCELRERYRLITAIDESLKICFNSEENINGYMRMVNHNHPFNGARPLDLALESLDGLKMVDLEIAKLINI